MSIKLTAPPIRLTPKGEVKSVYISDKTKELFDFLRKESGNSQDMVMYDALMLYKNALEQVKGVKYNLEGVLQ